MRQFFCNFSLCFICFTDGLKYDGIWGKLLKIIDICVNYDIM